MGEYCEAYGLMFRSLPRALYIGLQDRGETPNATDFCLETIHIIREQRLFCDDGRLIMVMMTVQGVCCRS